MRPVTPWLDQPQPAAWLLAMCAALLVTPSEAETVEVDVQLVLAADVSGSMSSDELRLQRESYVAALRERTVAQAVLSGGLGRIALTYVEWAGVDQQAVVVPWTIVESGRDLEDFADRLAEGSRLVTGRSAITLRGSPTSISDALLFAADRFGESGVRSFGRTIDISGDGPNNEGPDIGLARDAIVARGITINAIAIGLPDRATYGPYDLFGTPDESLRPYYEDNVIGGPGAFAMSVAGLNDFAETIQRKLVLEISAVRPTPHYIGLSTLARLGN